MSPELIVATTTPATVLILWIVRKTNLRNRVLRQVSRLHQHYRCSRDRHDFSCSYGGGPVRAPIVLPDGRKDLGYTVKCSACDTRRSYRHPPFR